MKLEQLHQLINANKKLVSIKKPIKKLFKAILYSHTGKRILSTINEVRSDLKEDLTVIFKPVKRFTAKQLKGVDATKINSDHKKEIDKNKATLPLQNKSAGHTKVPANNGFVNWFEIKSDNKKDIPMVSLKKTDGRIVPLDDYWIKD